MFAVHVLHFHQGRSDGGYIGIYAPNQSTVNFLCGCFVSLTRTNSISCNLYPPKSNSWLRLWFSCPAISCVQFRPCCSTSRVFMQSTRFDTAQHRAYLGQERLGALLRPGVDQILIHIQRQPRTEHRQHWITHFYTESTPSTARALSRHLFQGGSMKLSGAGGHESRREAPSGEGVWRGGVPLPSMGVRGCYPGKIVKLEA